MKKGFIITQNFLNNLAMVIAAFSIFILILALGMDRYAASITPTLTPTITNTPRPTRTPYPPTPTITPTMFASPTESEPGAPLPDHSLVSQTPEDFMAQLEIQGYDCQTSSRLLQQGFEWVCTRSTEDASHEVLIQGRDVQSIDFVRISLQTAPSTSNEKVQENFLLVSSMLFTLTPQATSTPENSATTTLTPPPVIVENEILAQINLWLADALPAISPDEALQVDIEGIPFRLQMIQASSQETASILDIGFSLVMP